MPLPAIQKTTKCVIDLKENLKEMPSNMHAFSLLLRSLFAENAVGTSSDVAQKFRKLRDDTRQDAILYLKCHLPISTKLVSSIEEYFKYYEHLSYEEWCEILPDILEETITCKEVAQTLVEMYEDLVIALKKREDQAKIIMTEFTDLQREFEEQRNKFMDKAKEKIKWASFLLVFPPLAFIFRPLLHSLVEVDVLRATAKKAQSEIHKVAALAVANVLIPALSSFIDGLKKAVGFFQVMEKELRSFEGQARKGIELPKRLHYKVVNKEAKEMKSLCQAFYAVLPDVRTDFEAIPNEGTDQNYVDKWLEKQLAENERKRSRVQQYLLDVFSGMEAKFEWEEIAEGEEKAEGEEEQAE